MKSLTSFFLRWIFGPLILIVLHLWSFGALYYSPVEPEFLRMWLAALYGAGIPLAVILRRSRKWAVLLPLAGFLCVLAYEYQIQPKKNACYPPEVGKTAYAEFKGDRVTLHNVRNADYRTVHDFETRWETREYELKYLRTLDVFMSYWGMDAIAHVFVSFGFTQGRYLAVSVECRPEVGESYGMFKGFFKHYEIIYVWADERDVVRLRTNYRKEDVYLYRTLLAPAQVRSLFVSMLERTNKLDKDPEFYNTVTDSCTNTIGNHIVEAKVFDLPFWKRRLLTGTLDRRLYQQGLLETLGRSFPALRVQSRINAKAQAADRDEDFSMKIRTHQTKV